VIFEAVCTLFLKLRIDDPLSAAPMHGFGGMWGAVITGLLAKQEYVVQVGRREPPGANARAARARLPHSPPAPVCTRRAPAPLSTPAGGGFKGARSLQLRPGQAGWYQGASWLRSAAVSPQPPHTPRHAQAYGSSNHYGALYPGGGGRLLACQLIGIVTVAAWVVVHAGILFVILRKFGMLRIPPEEEQMGLDVSKHGGAAYNYDHGIQLGARK
jgi:hypothetical protein